MNRPGPSLKLSHVPSRSVAALACVVGIVLRWMDLAGPAPSPDELFTGTVARSRLFDIPARALDLGDTHPPLDYLIRHPFVTGDSIFGLRAPSAVFATAALLITWRWMRDRGWFGTWVVIGTALSPFLILYGRQARMYSLVILAGTLVAVAAERWLATGGRGWIWLMAVTVAVGLLADSTAILLPAGALSLVGRRTDAAAWRWRGGLAGALAVWLALWAWRIPAQYGASGAAWIPLVDASTAVSIVGELVAVFYPASGVVLTALMIAGTFLLRPIDSPLHRVVVTVAAVPLGLGLLAAFVLHIGLARSFAAVAWAPPILLAAAIIGIAHRWRVVGAVSVVFVAVLVLPSTALAVTFTDPIGRAARIVAAEAVPGDQVTIGAPRLAHVLTWTYDRPMTGILPGTTELGVMAVDGVSTNGRLWVIEIGGGVVPAPGRRPCPDPPYTDDDVRILCYEPLS